ncbi:MAG: guanylate kinase [Faecalibacterium sp.]|jgi:guanylate kinase|nr:guanylate kinase [Faecalibacterium sp.]
MNNEKCLFITSGPAGVGKDSVVAAMRAAHPEIERSVTATTRAPRPGEVDGVHYHFRTVAQFETLKAEGGVLESNFYCGNYYGTLRSDVEARLAAGKIVVLVIDVNGAGNIKKIYPGATTIFICPPSVEELERRLRGRGTEDEATIQKRMARAREELALAPEYDAEVVNRTVDQCADDLYALIRARSR